MDLEEATENIEDGSDVQGGGRPLGSDHERAGFLSPEPGRTRGESVLVRLVATAGVIAIGTALGAALFASDLSGWIISLVVSVVCVALAALLWRSREL